MQSKRLVAKPQAEVRSLRSAIAGNASFTPAKRKPMQDILDNLIVFIALAFAVVATMDFVVGLARLAQSVAEQVIALPLAPQATASADLHQQAQAIVPAPTSQTQSEPATVNDLQRYPVLELLPVQSPPVEDPWLIDVVSCTDNWCRESCLEKGKSLSAPATISIPDRYSYTLAPATIDIILHACMGAVFDDSLAAGGDVQRRENDDPNENRYNYKIQRQDTKLTPSSDGDSNRTLLAIAAEPPLPLAPDKDGDQPVAVMPVKTTNSKRKKAKAPVTNTEFTTVSTHLDRMTALDLRKLCTQKNIQWRNVRGKGKHLNKVEMLEQLTAFFANYLPLNTLDA